MENKIMTEVNEKKVSGSSSDKKDRRGNKRRNSINNRGMGTVEMILIIVVLIGLVLIFKTQIMELTESIFQKIAADSSAILA
ncbi:MAG: Flp1 family type IVb pilin [Lachnospiraceae bacterium]